MTILLRNCDTLRNAESYSAMLKFVFAKAETRMETWKKNCLGFIIFMAWWPDYRNRMGTDRSNWSERDMGFSVYHSKKS